MPKFFIAIFLLLILVGCSNREKGSPVPNYGYRYFANKVVYIDGSTADVISLPDACSDLFSKMGWFASQNIPESEWHRYAKTDKWCISLLTGRPDTTIYSLRNPSDTELCDSDGKCIVKPDIYLKENNVFQVSFCDSKYFTQMRYDSLNVLRDFAGENAAWKVYSPFPYNIMVSDTLIVLRNGRKNENIRENEDIILFYVEKKEWCKDCPPGKDVSMKLRRPFWDVKKSVCDISF